MSRPTVLVIEDNKITRRMFRVALESQAWAVVEAGDGASALAAVLRGPPDVIVSDLTLPDADGVDLLRRVQALPGAADIPVLATSGFLSRLDEARSLSAGFVEHLFKPVDPLRLIEAVRAHLRPAADRELPGQGRRLLVVDDDPVQARLLRLQLERAGFTVTTAGDGAEALALALERRPDAVVSDILMAGLDGFQLCLKVRTDPRLAGVPVVLVSVAFSEEGDRALARRVGASALVVRGPEHTALVEAVVESLRTAASAPVPTSDVLHDDYTQRMIRQLERQVGQNTEMARRLALHEAAMGVLAEIGDRAKSPGSLEKLLPELLHHALDAAGISIGAVFLLDPGEAFTLAARQGFRADADLDAFFGRREVLARALASLEVVHVPAGDAPAAWEAELLAGAGARSLVVLPLRLGEDRLGALVLAAASARLSVEWLPFAEAIGVQISQAVALARAVRRIAAEQERFRELAESMPHIVWAATGDGRADYYNDRWYELSGLTRGTSPATAWLDVIHPDDRAPTLASWARALETGARWELEYRLRDARTGKDRWHLGRAVPVRDAAGAVSRWYGVAIDIDDRKTVELELRESEARLRQITENIQEVFWMADQTLETIFYINPAYEAVWGRTRESLYADPRSWADAIDPADRAATLPHILRSLAEGAPFDHKFRIRRPDGSQRWIHDRGFPVRNDAGVVDRYVGTAMDVTDLTLAVEEHRRATRLARLVADIGVALTGHRDLDEALRGCARALVEHLDAGLARIWRYDPLRRALDLRASAGPCGAPDPVAALARATRIAEGRQPVVTADLADPAVGDREWAAREGIAAVAGHPLLVDGRVVGVLVMFARRPLDEATLRAIGSAADVIAIGIERERAESARVGLEGQLRRAQKMEAVGRLAGGVAHDFNNVLTAILGYSELMLHRLDPRDPLRKDVDEIRKAGERASSLTRQLLVFSRHEAVAPQVLDPNAVLLDMQKMVLRLIGEDLDLRVVLGPELGRVKVDKGYLEQVVLNLCVNARDSMPRGGRLTIETANVELAANAHGLSGEVAPGRYVLLAVSDTGSGMTADVLSHLFEPFFTTKEAGKGTGLGLSTVYGIVHTSGGHISVYSEPGLGSSFKVYLPRVDDAVTAAPGSAQGAVRRGHETVLLVEDDPMVQALAQRVLELNGYRVVAASNGGEALLICEQHVGRLDLIVTDVIMPKMSGPELAERLERLRPGIRVLFCSGYTNGAIQHAELLRAGSAFLQKPFTPDSLARKVREVLDAP